MRFLFLLTLITAACGSPPAPSDAGLPGPVMEELVLPFTELPPERIAVTCREIVGAQFTSIDPSDPQHWRADNDGVILSSTDEGRTWTRAPVQTFFKSGNLFVGPVIVAQANLDPLVADAGLKVSLDRGATWRTPDFRVVDDSKLPPATAIATFGATKIAWTPSGLIRVSLDDGATWKTEPNAYPLRGGDDVRAALDDREWFVDAKEQRTYRSRNGGRTWERVPWRRTRQLELLGARGVIMSGGRISQDDGDTWITRTGLSDLFAVGPAEGELWAVTSVTGTDKPRLMHSKDWGASFAPVTISYGAAGEGPGTEPGVARVFAMPDGRRVFVPRIETVPLNPFSWMVCIETSGAGSLEQATPAKNDTPGTASLWALGNFGFALGTLQQAVPLREPGRAFGITSRTFPDTHAITGGTRLPNGDVAVLLQPRPVIDLNAGPPMKVQVLDGTTLQPTRTVLFDDLQRNTVGRETKYLESAWLQALPDAGLRTDTTEGDYPIGTDPAVWVPWPSKARWGIGGRGAQIVTYEQIGATRFLRLTSDLSEVSAFCTEAGGATERCVSYAGNVTDWAHRNGRVYVLDAWRGEVLEATYASRDNIFRPVLTGLAKPTSLFAPIDDDPGLYVVDTHLYRFVPGPTAARRP